MTDPIRAALERLIKAIEGIELEGVPEVDDAITAARAALANAEPASVVKDSLTTAPPELQRPWSGEVAAWSAKLRPADSTPPAEGEVAKWLGSHAADWEEVGLVEWADKCTRIQALLEQRHPAPVAVSDDQLDLVVIAIQALAPHQPDATTHDLHAVDRGREMLRQCLVHWGLPAWVHALPLPAGEEKQ